MITGLVLVIIGLPLGLYGATRFNYGIMFAGWAIAAAGAVVFVTHVVTVW
jgi:hypothetical protein